MTLIPRVAGVMQLIFGQLATELAKTGQFIKRTRKLTGEKSAQILIFSWLSHATYCDMAQTALSLGNKNQSTGHRKTIHRRIGSVPSCSAGESVLASGRNRFDSNSTLLPVLFGHCC